MAVTDPVCLAAVCVAAVLLIPFLVGMPDHHSAGPVIPGCQAGAVEAAAVPGVTFISHRWLYCHLHLQHVEPSLLPPWFLLCRLTTPRVTTTSAPRVLPLL